MNRIQELEQEIEIIKGDYDWYSGWDRLNTAKEKRLVKESALSELRRRNAEIKQVIEKLPFSDIAKFQLLTALGLEEMQT